MLPVMGVRGERVQARAVASPARKHSVRREFRAPQRGVDPFTRERVEESRRIADEDAPVIFVRAPASPPSQARGTGTGYGPYFGMIPEFGGPEVGVTLGGVRAGSPAERAGLQSGDLIVRFDGKVVKNLEDFVFILRGKRAGDRVEVVYRRGTEVRSASAVLEARH